MKIISCHIENFGKLSNFNINFLEGANIINQDNGWGKSTLVNFVKVMFFGFSNEKAKKIVDNDRKKFRPWQGGVYGGNIKFESDGKQYELYRTFGLKSSEDTFSIKDAETNLESNEFTQNIGEELFRIDGESFLRTACIFQNDCITKVTDSINSKLGNLADNTDDINNYEKVIKQLDNMKNRLSPTRKTGEIYKITEQIHTIKSGMSSEIDIEMAMSKNKELLENEKCKRQKLKEDLICVQNNIEIISKRKAMLIKLENYEKLCSEYSDKNDEKNRLEVYFKNEIPNEADIEKILEKSENLAILKNQIENSVFDDKELKKYKDLKNKFKEKLPMENEIFEYKEKAENIDKFKLYAATEGLTRSEENELEYLKNKFFKISSMNLGEEDFEKNIKDWNKRTEIKSGLGLKKAALDNMKIDNEGIFDKKKINLGLPISIIIMLISCVLMFLGIVEKIGFIAGIVIGTIILIISLINLRKNKINIEEYKKVIRKKSNAIMSYEEKIIEEETIIRCIEEQVEKFVELFGDDYVEPEILNILYNEKNMFKKYNDLNLKKEIYDSKGYKQKLNDAKKSVSAFLLQYFNEEMEDENYTSLLQRLELEVIDFKILNEKKNVYDTTKEIYNNISSELKNYIMGLGIEPAENMAKQLNEINIKRKDYIRIKKEFDLIKREKQIFEDDNDIVSIKMLVSDNKEESVESLQRTQYEINEKLEQISENIRHYQNIIDSESRQQSEMEEDKNLLIQLMEKKDILTKRYIVAENTRNYLQKAKENLTSKYMNPIMKSFKKYFEILTKDEGDNCKIDAKISIKIVEKGAQRDVEFLSTGYQDLIGICMRVALVDAMYEGEKPFLIFDDPFVNLDESKVLGGIKLLQEISKDYQILYLTCHESRSFS